MPIAAVFLIVAVAIKLLLAMTEQVPGLLLWFGGVAAGVLLTKEFLRNE